MLYRLPVCVISGVLALLAQDNTASLTGVVQVFDGEAARGGSVLLQSASGEVRRETPIEQGGGFRFSGLPADSYTLRIRQLGFFIVKLKQNLLASEQRSLPPVRLRLAPAGYCVNTDADPDETRFLSSGGSAGGLTGSVKSGIGPVAGARVGLACWQLASCSDHGVARTDAQGKFEFENIPPGLYTLTVSQDGFIPLTQQFVVTGGLESSYSLTLRTCSNRECTVNQDPSVKSVMCE